MATTAHGWRYEVNIKAAMNREDEPTVEGHKTTARDIAAILKDGLREDDRDELTDVIERLEELGDPTDDYYSLDDLESEINSTLDDVYDYADATRIWLGIA